jgi:hypothetical protein
MASAFESLCTDEKQALTILAYLKPALLTCTRAGRLSRPCVVVSVVQAVKAVNDI